MYGGRDRISLAKPKSAILMQSFEASKFSGHSIRSVSLDGIEMCFVDAHDGAILQRAYILAGTRSGVPTVQGVFRMAM